MLRATTSLSSGWRTLSHTLPPGTETPSLYLTHVLSSQVFNKVDVTRHDFALEWMADFESYHAALERDASYASTLSRSLSLVLDEFYTNMRSVGVSAVTGEGMAEFFEVRGLGRGGGEGRSFLFRVCGVKGMAEFFEVLGLWGRRG